MKRVTLFAGHYGSGKTNLAVNYARAIRRREPTRPVTIADLDIVNPYFRTKDSEAELRADGIGLVVSGFANSNVDFPAMPKAAYALFGTGADLPAVVVDVGGDDRGALALGRYVPDILAESDYEMLGVVNASRPLTRDPASAVEVLREIEVAAGLPITGIVNNTNLGMETRAEDVVASVGYAEAVARMMSVPVSFTACMAALAPQLEGKIDNLFPIDIQRLYYQLR